MTNVFFYEPFYDFDRFIEEAFRQVKTQSRCLSGSSLMSTEPMDLHENHEKNIVTASFEFPGIPKENIEINIHNGRLIVSAETSNRLPQGIKEDDIKASVENGVLTVTFPKSTPELAPKRIQIA
ncbi:small heat shock protein [Pholiota molesta]|nr:small heat shock protein [Pholiota molesta]